jgi:hypothetical protein
MGNWKWLGSEERFRVLERWYSDGPCRLEPISAGFHSLLGRCGSWRQKALKMDSILGGKFNRYSFLYIFFCLKII